MKLNALVCILYVTSCVADTVFPAAVIERFHINRVASVTRALICLVTLTFWPWNWWALLAMGWAIFLQIFVLYLWVNTSHTHNVTSRLWPLICHGACRWYGSSCSIVYQVLKFVGLRIRKIWHTFGLSIRRSGDRDLWPWNWWALLPMGWGNLSTNFVVYGTFRSPLMGQHVRRTT